MTIKTTNFTYIPGELSLERLPGPSGTIDDSTRFRLEGNWAAGMAKGADHMQLIYEALEIAANSNDKFKQVFNAFVQEFMVLNADWVD